MHAGGQHVSHARIDTHEQSYGPSLQHGFVRKRREGDPLSVQRESASMMDRATYHISPLHPSICLALTPAPSTWEVREFQRREKGQPKLTGIAPNVQNQEAGIALLVTKR